MYVHSGPLEKKGLQLHLLIFFITIALRGGGVVCGCSWDSDT